MGRLSDTVTALVSRVKGESYVVDPRVGDDYLLGVLWERVWMKARGLAIFPRRTSRPFVGRGAQVRCRRQFQCGSGVTLGRDSYVDCLSETGVHWGDNVSLGRNSRVECTGNLRALGKGMRVEDNVGLGTDCFYGCAGGIEIGADTLIGNFVSMHSENHVIADPTTPIRMQGVEHRGIKIGRNCWIGAKATVLDGTELGNDSVVAAGAVLVAGTYQPGGIYGGTPARLLKLRPGYDRPE